MESQLLQLLLQGTPYGILVVCLLAVWSKYQESLTKINDLNKTTTDNQQKLIETLLGKVKPE